MARYLTDLADIARAAGLKVVELPGWQTRGRPGDFDPRGVLCHHTAGSGDTQRTAEQMALEGRPDLKPPLAQIALSRTGIVYVMAAGRANHAGKMKAIAGLPAGDGNEQLLGIEAMNTGFEGWGPAQFGAYVRLCAALCNAYDWPAYRVLGHKETSLSGKIDPGKMSMPDFRADVARDMATLKQPVVTPAGVYPGVALRRGATGPKVAELQTALGLDADGSYGPGTEAAVRTYQTAHALEVDGIAGPATWASLFQEDDMAMTPADRQALIEDIRDAILWAPTFPGQDGLGGSSIRNNIGVAAGNAMALRGAVAALAAGLGPTVQAAVQAALDADYEANVTLTKKES